MSSMNRSGRIVALIIGLGLGGVACGGGGASFDSTGAMRSALADKGVVCDTFEDAKPSEVPPGASAAATCISQGQGIGLFLYKDDSGSEVFMNQAQQEISSKGDGTQLVVGSNWIAFADAAEPATRVQAAIGGKVVTG